MNECRINKYDRVLEKYEYAAHELERLGYEVNRVNSYLITFMHNGHNVRLFPFSGWWMCKGLKSGKGRGFEKLLYEMNAY